MTKEGPHAGLEAEAHHRLGETVIDQGAVGPLNRILLARAGEVQVDPDPLAGGRKFHGFSV